MESRPLRPLAGIAAAAMLTLMGGLMFASAWNDSLTVDEVPHLAAGYSYLLKGDYRFNPEHPPLMKDLGALPLLFMNLRAPWTDKSWTEDSFGEWEFGKKFVYGNDADAVTRAARAPMILFTVALGGLIFWWTRRRFGDDAGLLALFLYTFSPTFLAHGRLVTNDVGAAAGFFSGTIAFLRFLKKPAWPNVLLAGFVLGLAFLTKFSTFMLAPIALVLAALWALLDEPGNRSRSFLRRAYGTVAVLVVAAFTIYAVYMVHIRNYPPERQRADSMRASQLSEMHGVTRDLMLWGSGGSLLRPWAEYGLGLLMTYRRARHGGNPYFLGDVSGAAGAEVYFPIVYFIKEPLALHVLTLLALAFAIRRCLRPVRTRAWLREHFAEAAFAAVTIAYWAFSMRSSLRIGVRHILPTLPFIYVLAAIAIAAQYRQQRVFRIVVIALLGWQAVSVVRVHPSYLAYFNEVAGGPEGGWQYVTDSNLDWGQDLKRLAQFVDQRGIREISLDYFGSADTAYYMANKAKSISSCSQPVTGWVAVSAMSYTESRRKPECDYRRWLPMEKLAARAGYSIFVFQVD